MEHIADGKVLKANWQTEIQEETGPLRRIAHMNWYNFDGAWVEVVTIEAGEKKKLKF